MQVQNYRPCILCIGGLDPSGGAGLQADIETIAACGGHALPIASCLTIQNTTVSTSVSAVEPDVIKSQVSLLIDDFKISGCKIGLIPNASIARTIAEIVSQIPDVPIVFDPVIRASSGLKFNDNTTLEAIKKFLLPKVTIITPNQNELNAITNCDKDKNSQCELLCSLGPEYVLITGGDNQTSSVSNLFVSKGGNQHEYTWQRLPNRYHGSGCTLSSAIASYLALGFDMQEAVQKGQQFTWHALDAAEPLGKSQWMPNRTRISDEP